MKIFDTMKRGKVEIDLQKSRVVKLFVCGPTVQDSIHLGHARTYIFFDVFAKYLRSKGYDVFYLQNITDIDDKIIRKAKEEGISFSELAARNTGVYMNALGKLGIDSINFFARSTLFVDRIVEQVETLLKKGFAYRTEDGVYFRVSSFNDYGMLSGQPQNSLLEGARVETSELKESQRDFVIWKARKEGEPFWSAPFGEGRPGWHIEDTAITESLFGYTYDIHGGGSDLIFPHHEAEIAIERSISGKDLLSRYWVHTGMLNLNDEKMSKSSGNFITLESTLEKWSSFELRYAFLNSQYRSVVNMSDETLQEARSNCAKFSNMYHKLKREKFSGSGIGIDPETWRTRMSERFEDDMDTRGVITVLNDLAYKVNSSFPDLSEAEAMGVLNILEWANSILGILDTRSSNGNLDGIVQILIDLRNSLRKKRDFENSDLIRKKLQENGIYIEDRDHDTIWWQK